MYPTDCQETGVDWEALLNPLTTSLGHQLLLLMISETAKRPELSDETNREALPVPSLPTSRRELTPVVKPPGSLPESSHVNPIRLY